MKFIPNKVYWLSLSGIMVAASLMAMAVYGFRLSADFTEGTLIGLQFTSEANEAAAPTEVTQEQFREALNEYTPAEGQESIAGFDLKRSPDGQFILRTKRLDGEQTESLIQFIESSLGDFQLLQSRDVTPLFAQNFRDRALLAIAVASIMIILYITFAFRKVSRGIKSWKLGVTAIIALIHDIAIIVGVFVLMGYYLQVEIDILFITALLSIMGFSVHDTIVVFDRLRENLLTKHHQESFDQVAEKSIQQTLARSINTSVTTLLVMIPLLIWGAPEIFNFILALSLGLVIGTYSSIFVATPLLTYFERAQRR
ncbi:MAG: protein translocase subunit SecF [Candidatus Altimarinota bacterium]